MKHHLFFLLICFLGLRSNAGIRELSCLPQQLELIDSTARRIERGEIAYSEMQTADSLVKIPLLQNLNGSDVREVLSFLLEPVRPVSKNEAYLACGVMADKFILALSDEILRYSGEYKIGQVARMKQNLRNYLQYYLFVQYTARQQTDSLTAANAEAMTVAELEKFMYADKQLSLFYDRFYFIMRNSNYAFFIR